jgi:glycerol-1-phosphate dehydrogenase [NAD(P)+]
MQLPREIFIGKNTIKYVNHICNKLKLTRASLIITGSKTYYIAGKMVKELLESEGIKAEILLVKEATLKEVKIAEEKIKSLEAQVVFGVGGGTKIDIAKLSSAKQKIPFISIPTTASHDGIASPLSSVKGLGNPFSIMAQAPIAIIADTNIIMQAPQRQIISGCSDVISKLTAVKDWKLAYKEKKEYYGEYAANLALMSTKPVMQNADIIKSGKEEGIRVLLEALISCGVAMSIAGSSRPCSGSEHLFSHALDVVKPNNAMHGEQCGFGTIIMMHLHRSNWRNVKKTLEKLGAPTKCDNLYLEQEEVIRALLMAPSIRPNRYTILSKLKLDFKDYQKVLKITGTA